MYLKELEIFGFKSFPQKTSLKFESGITAVVGPNGCGKSNVFDSIKWALGEQSPKSLRGSKMEDVIFSGTETQAPLNYAEVVLTFSNEDRYLPIDYKEVSVARRLYRSGESEYFINKNPIRLKDVQELFMGTGVGESTYSFVEQGKIEIFLSYKPEDKRLIFDEASGIVKYKERRRDALRKLAEAEENLLRLDDILSEVRRQIRYLERQVFKAKKYKEVQKELIEAEKKIANLQFKDLEGKINSTLDELSIFKDKEQKKDIQLQDVNKGWEGLNDKLKSLRNKIEEVSTAMVSIKAQIESSNSHIVLYKQRIKEIDERNISFEQAKNSFGQRLELHKQRIRDENDNMQAIEESIKILDENALSMDGESESLRSKIEEAKKNIKNDKEKILSLESNKVQLNNAVIEIQTKLSALLNRKRRLVLDKARLETLLSENNERFKGAEEEVLVAQAALRSLESKKSSLVSKEKGLATLAEENRCKLIDKEKELVELNASYEFIKDLRSKYETFSLKKEVTIIFDEEPQNINKLVASLQNVEFEKDGNKYKARIEVKVVSFEEKQLEEKMNLTKDQIEQAKTALDDIGQQTNVINQDISVENGQIEQERVKLSQASKEKDGLERELERLKEESDLIEQETNTALSDIKYCENSQNSSQKQLTSLEADLSQVNQNLQDNQDIAAKALERIKEIDIEAARATSEKQALHKEKESLKSKIILFKDEIKNIDSGLEQIEKDKDDDSLKSVSFDEQIKGLDSKIGEGRQKVDEHIKEKESFEQEEGLLNKEIESTKGLMQNIEKEGQEIKDSIYNKKLEVQSLEYEKQKIKDYLTQVYNIEFDPKAIGQVEESIDDVIANKEKLQKRVQSLGEVNLVAIEEFEELKKRDDFLEGQKQDLVTSKENLKKAIQKINRISRDIFLDTFGKIEVEFKKNFRFLFNGGRANLILIDRDNILESGVEIEVQPPGKKLQNVSLLSGGEKALTAIALIFAIFSVRPSPLCVLDEIDAPLDEANVDRFNHLLKEFSASSQFILITHNKITMSNADVLYGVTMQEKGISKLVSVKFAPEEAPA